MFGGQTNFPQPLSAPFFHWKNVKFGFYKVILKSEESWFAPKCTNLRIFLYWYLTSRDYMWYDYSSTFPHFSVFVWKKQVWKLVNFVIFWRFLVIIWLYDLDPMYIRGLHTDFEVHSIKNQKITTIFLAAIFLINLKIFSQRVLKTAVTRSILVLLRSGFLQTSYFL